MTGTPDPRARLDTEDDGPAAPPLANGELVFTEPWQPRLFAATMRMCEQGHLRWDIFRQSLIVEIALHEADRPTGPDTVAGGLHPAFDYWGCWQRALERLLCDVDLVPAAELADRARAVASGPPDH